MRYRGFEITSTPDYAITRQSGETGVNETCKGYYCQIYPHCRRRVKPSLQGKEKEQRRGMVL